MSANDRVAIITGAGRGIGLACARRFARNGYKVVIADVDEDAGRAAQTELEGQSEQALFVHCDVGERLHIRNLMAATLNAYNRVDVLINNAAIIHNADFLTLEEADFDRVMAVNLKGAFLVSQAIARQMVEQISTEKDLNTDSPRYYSIINMSSVNAVLAVADQIPYAVSKGAINQLTRVMSVALAPHGIRVNAIGPGTINTDIMKEVVRDSKARQSVLDRTPLGRIGDADEVASIAAFLASPDASYITGQCIYADGGRLPLNYTVRNTTDGKPD